MLCRKSAFILRPGTRQFQEQGAALRAREHRLLLTGLAPQFAGEHPDARGGAAHVTQDIAGEVNVPAATKGESSTGVTNHEPKRCCAFPGLAIRASAASPGAVATTQVIAVRVRSLSDSFRKRRQY
jgi:hypothetical protein